MHRQREPGTDLVSKSQFRDIGYDSFGAPSGTNRLAIALITDAIWMMGRMTSAVGDFSAVTDARMAPRMCRDALSCSPDECRCSGATLLYPSKESNAKPTGDGAPARMSHRAVGPSP